MVARSLELPHSHRRWTRTWRQWYLAAKSTNCKCMLSLNDAVSGQVTEYKGRRDAVVDLLNNIPGVRCPTPTVLSHHHSVLQRMIVLTRIVLRRVHSTHSLMSRLSGFRQQKSHPKSCTRAGNNSVDCLVVLLTNRCARCALLPGSDFGVASEGYLRISYVSSLKATMRTISSRGEGVL